MVAISKQQKKFSNSSIAVYRDYVASGASVLQFIYQEVVSLLFCNLAGLFGFAARTLLFPKLFLSCGARPMIGRSVTIRGGKQIKIGTKVMLDDYAVLDARKDSDIEIGDYVSVGRSSALIAKGAKIKLANGVNISSDCRIASESSIEIGESSLVSAFCYIGPGNHQRNSEQAVIEQDMHNKGGVTIGKNVWIGARVTIMDGVTIGDNAVVGAHSFVKNNVPANTTVFGTPAKKIA